MVQNKKRIISLILMLTLLVSSLVIGAITASAAPTDATISFANTAQRVSQTSAAQVWKNGDVTFTNNKASSSTAVADYSNPVRLYAGSNIVIEAPGKITEIVFTANSTEYATNLKASISQAGNADVSLSNTKVTVKPNPQSSSYEFTLTKQVRLNSLTVTYEVAGGEEIEPGAPTCAHENTSSSTVDATCTESGSITVICDDCDETVSTTAIPATGHDFSEAADDNRNCKNCTAEAYKVEFVTSTTEKFNAIFTLKMDKNFPTVTSAPEGYIFIGWITKEVEDDTTKPTSIKIANSEDTLNEDTIYYALYSFEVGGEAGTGSGLTTIDKIGEKDNVVITMTKDGTIYALSSANGSSSSPSATATVTVSDGKITSATNNNILWNVVANDDGTYSFKAVGTTNYLYCTSSNTGVRVGTNTNNKFTIDGNYLKNEATGRYIGVYNNQDWRCYTNTTGNIANQTLGFYVIGGTAAETHYTTNISSDCEHANTTETTNDATCTNDGSKVVTCIDCGNVVSTTKILATGHTNTTTSSVGATCTTYGSTTVTCDDCTTVVSTELIAPTGVGVFEKVTENLTDWSGVYLIVYEGGQLAFDGSLLELDVANNGFKIDIINGTIEVDDDILNKIFTIESSGDGWAIKSASGYYITGKSGENDLIQNPKINGINTITIDGNGTLQIVSNGSILRFNKANSDNSMRFRYYKSGQEAIALYRLVYHHDYNQEKVDNNYLKSNANCENAAVYYKSCKCGAVNKEEGASTFVYGTSLGHTGGTATCTAQAKCTRCGNPYGNIDASKHSWNVGEVTTAPTCSAEGVKTYTCAHNGEHTKTETIAIDENKHSWNVGEVTTAPTCSAEGVKTYTCAHNGEHT
ncbi:MAG: RICIN domain-containing protein, partial [Clostridia bacterium]|nr:RICIN domain-containing protein [Clostridia bacterium]